MPNPFVFKGFRTCDVRQATQAAFSVGLVATG
ncbi:hypothetical protein CO2235_30047 [Cupriavidus oxalaticus]|uniref:Uncharacterized protein n=1 Tax=Cupriavidus oxalaticus TaxID=96344 RepID=A0A375G9Q0_9BURK|nr:hypothetical protein CO2235_30047 [Cupriavidus oxalaticus]